MYLPRSAWIIGRSPTAYGLPGPARPQGLRLKQFLKDGHSIWPHHVLRYTGPAAKKIPVGCHHGSLPVFQGCVWAYVMPEPLAVPGGAAATPPETGMGPLPMDDAAKIPWIPVSMEKQYHPLSPKTIRDI